MVAGANFLLIFFGKTSAKNARPRQAEVHLQWAKYLRREAVKKSRDVLWIPQHAAAQKEKSRGRRADQCEPQFYYIQCPKIGMLYHKSNFRPYVDFTVKDKCLFGYLQSQKMTIKAVTEETLNSQNPPFFLYF